VKAGGIGKKRSNSTNIYCGIDFAVKQEIEKYINQLRLISAKLTKLREMMAEPNIHPEKEAKMQELLQRLENAQQTTSTQVSGLMGKMNVDENAVVEVIGEIAPGTMIEICQVAFLVEEPLQKVRIRLNRDFGKLMLDPLK
jgi:uncharacterized protein (DUF342 family)